MSDSPHAYLAWGFEVEPSDIKDDFSERLASYLGVPPPSDPWSEGSPSMWPAYWEAQRKALEAHGVTHEQDGGESKLQAVGKALGLTFIGKPGWKLASYG